MKYLLKVLIVLLGLLVPFSYVNAAAFFTDAGSVQLGGGIAFSSEGNENRDDRINYFEFSPLVNFFPIPYFLVGPAVSFRLEGRGGFDVTSFSLGANAGFAYGLDMVVIPFAYGSPQLLLNFWDDGSNAGFGIDITGGVIVPILEHFSINAGPGFWFQVVDGNWSNTIYIDVSITGLIF